MDENILKKCLEGIKKSDSEIISTVSTVLSSTQDLGKVSVSNIEIIEELVIESLKKYEKYKQSNSEYSEWLLKNYESGKALFTTLASEGSLKNQRLAAFKCLINLLPLYKDSIKNKPSFPQEEYGEIVWIIINSDGDVAPFINVLQDFTQYEDMYINLWKAIDIACNFVPKLNPTKVKNILLIMGLFSVGDKKKFAENPKHYYCGVKVGILNPKKISECVRRIWEKLIAVDNLPPRTRQLLLLALLEKMMYKMEKPLYLTDYFMSSLEHGGAITLLSLQGIFELIQKHNINYPNIYDKLYDMFKPEIFDTTYKARFYYLSDLFLSSLHLPEALVAGFAKRFARLVLVAPPPDIIILLTFITNLIVRHPGLNVLISNMRNIQQDSDPYIANERDPSKSRALESGLWEVHLLQNHILPSVAAAASAIINNPVPTLEKDLSSLLEVTMDDIFEKESKKRMKDPPLTFEQPTPIYLSLQNNKLGFMEWDFNI